MDMGNIAGMTGQKPTVVTFSLNRKQKERQSDAEKLAALLGDEPAMTIEEMREREKAEREQRKAAEEERRKKEQQFKEQEKQNELQMLTKELENADKQADAIGDEFKVYARCLTIASRISRGDTVPMKDMKYLAEHEPDLFKQAILLRVPNDHPKKHKSVLEDDEEEQQTEPASESSEPGEAPVAETEEVAETETETE